MVSGALQHVRSLPARRLGWALRAAAALAVFVAVAAAIIGLPLAAVALVMTHHAALAVIVVVRLCVMLGPRAMQLVGDAFERALAALHDYPQAPALPAAIVVPRR